MIPFCDFITEAKGRRCYSMAIMWVKSWESKGETYDWERKRTDRDPKKEGLCGSKALCRLRKLCEGMSITGDPDPKGNSCRSGLEPMCGMRTLCSRMSGNIDWNQGGGIEMKKKWYDYLWVVSLTYLVLGFVNILFAWLGLFCFFIPLIISATRGTKGYCNVYCASSIHR